MPGKGTYYLKIAAFFNKFFFGSTKNKKILGPAKQQHPFIKNIVKKQIF